MSSDQSTKRASFKAFLEKQRMLRKSAGEPQEEEVIVPDPYKKTEEFKEVHRKHTAYVYSPALEHYCPWDLDHPEMPARAIAIHRRYHDLEHKLFMTEPTLEEVEAAIVAVHAEDYVNTLGSLCCGLGEVEAQAYDSLYYNEMLSYTSAVDAAKRVTGLAVAIIGGKHQNGFANVRPPGHHAGTAPNGYCLFNNVAIAAKYLLDKKLTERILIVDFDVHHGQGTQSVFYTTDKVLYFSIHRYEHGTFWPNLEESGFDCIGSEDGLGYNINVPLNETKMTDFDYLAIVTNLLLPVAYEYNPTIVLVSAGYDACIGCPEGDMNVTPAFYGHLMTMLGGLAGGKIVVALEGGYFIPSLAEGAKMTMIGLLNDPLPPLEQHKRLSNSVIDTINDVKVALRDYWKCFSCIDPIKKQEDITHYDQFHEHVAVKCYWGVELRPPHPTQGAYPQHSDRTHKMFLAKVMALDDPPMDETIVGYCLNLDSSLHEPPKDVQAYEQEARVSQIMEKLEEYDLLDKMFHIDLDEVGALTSDEINTVLTRLHGEKYLADLAHGIPQQPDLYWTDFSKQVCLLNCQLLCNIIDRISTYQLTHGLGIVRPPGHHAKSSKGNGFCLLNNVVIAADYALHHLAFKRVLILDFDVHFGDGTHELTYNRDDIMYISIHRFDQGKFFPKDPAGNYMYIGQGKAAGRNVNIPFNDAKMGNSDYLMAWLKLVVPLSYAFNPELIIISAGFDAGVNDPLGHYNVDPELFGHLVQLVKPLAPVLLALEGGYNLETTSLAAVNCTKALLGYPLPAPKWDPPQKATAETIANCLSVLKRYWPTLEVNKVLHPNIVLQNQMDDAVLKIQDQQIEL